MEHTCFQQRFYWWLLVYLCISQWENSYPSTKYFNRLLIGKEKKIPYLSQSHCILNRIDNLFGLFSLNILIFLHKGSNIGLTDAYVGRSFNHQLVTIKEFIVVNSLTLEETYTLLSTNFQTYDSLNVTLLSVLSHTETEGCYRRESSKQFN